MLSEPKNKTEYELANMLGMAFEGYANRLLNGQVAAYKGLLEQPIVEVVLAVTETGGIVASPFVPKPPDASQASKIRKLQKENKVLNNLIVEQSEKIAVLESPKESFMLMEGSTQEDVKPDEVTESED